MKKSQNSDMLPKEPGLMVTSAVSETQTSQLHFISSTLLLSPLRRVFSSLWVDLNWVWLAVFAAWIKLWSIEPSLHAHSHIGMHSASMPSSIFASIHLSLSFLAHWQLMIVAMMLPSVLPVVRAFRSVSRIEHQRSLMQIVFVLSYIAVWTLAAIGLCLIHVSIPLVSEIFWLKVAPSLKELNDWRCVQGGVLIGAGVFQFTPLKLNCLKGCRSAAMVIAQFYQQGVYGAWRLGWGHGLYCLGCCWALMLVMLGVGMSNLSIMLGLTAVMSLERLWKHGETLSKWVGVILVSGGLVLTCFYGFLSVGFFE